MPYISPSIFYAVLLLAALIWFFVRYFRDQGPQPGTLEWISMREKKPFSLPRRVHPMTRKDVLPLLAITLLYAATAFFYLGNTVSPQSFAKFSPEENTVTLDVGEPRQVERVFYFTGLYNASKGDHSDDFGYILEFSEDGQTWRRQQDMSQEYSETFYWLNAQLESPILPTRYIRITATRTPLWLGELSLFVREGEQTRRLPEADIGWDNPIGQRLFDEQDLVPSRYDILNSMEFDEIYHAYTAYEFLQDPPVGPYEWTHPPLGKHIIGLGIRVFGMTPFGFRVIPTLFGVLMLPLLYVFIKNIFGKTPVAIAGTVLFATDFMHLTQTRISTLDVFGVFIILCMYFFMYRYMCAPLDAPFIKSALPLALCGLSFGIGVATKWNCAYAGIGLLVLYVIALTARHQKLRRERKPFWGYLLKTLLWSVLFFILIPGVIYMLTYTTMARVGGHELTLTRLFEVFIKNQKDMFYYHAHSVLGSTHSYASTWYQWLIDWKPILFYANDNMGGGLRASISCFSNPVLCWGGLMALGACVVAYVKRNSFTALFVLLGFLSQLLPWVFVERITFAYHYFPSLLFCVLALCVVFDRTLERGLRDKRIVYLLPAISLILYVAFYPVLIGYPVPARYIDNFLKWLPLWPL